MSDAARSFIDKQIGRESAYRLLPVFAGGMRQEWSPAWVGLLGELDETMFERSDPRVAQTKLAWWGSDLAAGQRAQHPLSRQLLAAPPAAQVSAQDWQQLAEAALRLALQDATPADWESARSLWQPLAERVALIERRLFAVEVDPQLVMLQWQRQRLWHAQLLDRPEQSAAPLAWQADVGRSAATSWQAYATASESLLSTERKAGLPLHRSLLRSLWQWRLTRLRQGTDAAQLLAPSAPGLLWRSWRAAVKVARS